MPSVTLTESAKLTQNKLLAGIIENVVTVDQVYQYLPFTDVDGNALQYTRENALADVQTLAVGSTITANNAASFTTVTTGLTTIIGDAYVNGLIQQTRSNFSDQTQVQIGSKVKSMGRTYSNLMINGDSSANATQFDGILSLLPAGQTVGSSTDGDVLSFEKLDELMSLVKSKDGRVDAFLMNDREIRRVMTLYRALGGASINEVAQLPSGEQVPAYRGVPILRNDYLPINQTQGAASNASTVLAVNFDDGSGKVGISGLNAMGNNGINVKYIGESETKDESIYRVTFYCGFALFSDLAIAGATGIVPA